MLTKSILVNSLAGSEGSAGKSFSTKFVVFVITSPIARSHTAYNF